MKNKNKTALAKALNISRSSLYYVSKKEEKDWKLKNEIETVLKKRGQKSYGSRRIAYALGMNRKRIQRVMRKYGIKPYRKRGRKWRKKKKTEVVYENLLHYNVPSHPNHVWAADFTELGYHGLTVYIATVIDLFTREILGVTVSLNKGTQLTLQALYSALLKNSRSKIFHSDNGKEYEAKVFVNTLCELGIKISRSAPGCPWENGYQESFYDKFKVDLGDPNRFDSLGMLVAEIYRTVWDYNNIRIHSALRMPPRMFMVQYEYTLTDIKLVS